MLDITLYRKSKNPKNLDIALLSEAYVLDATESLVKQIFSLFKGEGLGTITLTVVSLEYDMEILEHDCYAINSLPIGIYQDLSNIINLEFKLLLEEFDYIQLF